MSVPDEDDEDLLLAQVAVAPALSSRRVAPDVRPRLRRALPRAMRSSADPSPLAARTRARPPGRPCSPRCDPTPAASRSRRSWGRSRTARSAGSARSPAETYRRDGRGLELARLQANERVAERPGLVFQRHQHLSGEPAIACRRHHVHPSDLPRHIVVARDAAARDRLAVDPADEEGAAVCRLEDGRRRQAARPGDAVVRGEQLRLQRLRERLGSSPSRTSRGGSPRRNPRVRRRDAPRPPASARRASLRDRPHLHPAPLGGDRARPRHGRRLPAGGGDAGSPRRSADRPGLHGELRSRRAAGLGGQLRRGLGAGRPPRSGARSFSRSWSPCRP